MANLSTPGRERLGQWFGITLGIALTTVDLVDAGLSNANAVGQRVFSTFVQVTAPVRAPLDQLGVTAALTRPINSFSAQVSGALNDLETRGRNAGTKNAAVTDQVVSGALDSILRYLREDSELLPYILAQLDWILPMLGEAQAVKDFVRREIAEILPELAGDPAISSLIRTQLAAILPGMASDEDVQRLIRAQVSSYLKYLNENPDEVQALIRYQGDVYIDYLNVHPAQVQTLLQGQSMSLASQVRDEIRERTVTADDLVDMFVRNLLRLKPREKLPPPPVNVQARAQSARLATDDQDEGHNGNT